MSTSARCLYEFDGFRLDPAERLLVKAGVSIPLTPKAFEMLVVLVSQSGRLLTKDELMQAVWPEAVVEENNLDKHISVLRKILGEHGAERKIIETVRGQGYRFSAAVQEIESEPVKRTTRVTVAAKPGPTAPAIADTQLTGTPLPVQTSPSSLVDGHAKPSGPKRWQSWYALVLAAVLLMTVLVALLAWRSRNQPSDEPREIKVTRLTNGGYIHNAIVSPDGKYFAYTEQDDAIARLWLRQVAGGQPIMLVPELGPSIPGLSFSPDGQFIYFVSINYDNPQGALYRVPVLGGAVTKVLTGIVSPVTFAPEGQRLAFIRAWQAMTKRTARALCSRITPVAMNGLC